MLIAMLGVPMVIGLIWRLVSLVSVGNKVSRLLGTVLGVSIGFVLLSAVFGVLAHPTVADMIEMFYPDAGAITDGSRFAPALTDTFDTFIRGVLIPADLDLWRDSEMPGQ